MEVETNAFDDDVLLGQARNEETEVTIPSLKGGVELLEIGVPVADRFAKKYYYSCTHQDRGRVEERGGEF